MKLTLEQQCRLSVLHSQYHAGWCSGDFRSQAISRHGIDPQSRNVLSPVSEEFTHWATIMQTTFLNASSWMKNFEFEMKFNFIKICLTGFNWQSVSIGSGNGLVTNHYLNQCWHKDLGAVSIRKTVLPGVAIPMLKIRRPNGRLIFNMEIAIRR